MKSIKFAILHISLSYTSSYFTCLTCLACLTCFPSLAYQIEISNTTLANTPVFLASYYGNQVLIVDSALTDANGKAVFARNYHLCTGMYTVVALGKLSYDILLDAGQQLHIEWPEANDVRITGDEQTAAYASYLAWVNTRPGKEQIAERHRQIIDQHPDTFLAAYLTALQPVEPPPDMGDDNDMAQLMKAYQYRRLHFFDNMLLSDVRLLRTQLFHETVQYYFTKFVTQQTDSLIYIAYRMLEQASGNYETFFYMSDFLIDFSLRNKIKDINKLHNFVQRNRDMLGVKGQAMLPVRTATNYFQLPDEKTLQNRLTNMPLTDIAGQAFDPLTLKNKYRIYYFWKNNCPRCVADVPRWQTVLNKYQRKSCFGIAVNTGNDVRQPENRILAYEPLCVNVSTGNLPLCETIFFTAYYSKIVVTDAEGAVIAVFGSAASLDNFLKIAR